MSGKKVWLRLVSLVLVFLVVLGSGVLAAPRIPTPESILGYPIGADYHLTEWSKIVEYMKALDKASDRVQVIPYGTTPEGRPMILTVVSSEQNIKNLKKYQEISARLADPRGLGEKEAQKLIKEGKAVYWICANIHSTEVGSAEMVMELAYKLAGGTDAQTKNILDNVIVVIDPSINPDGHDIFTEWYNKYKGTEWAGSRPPYYGKYVSHDNNRDLIALALPEISQNVEARFLFHPQVYHDLHQGVPRMWINPTQDPNDPNISPITQADWIKYGGYIISGMTAKGMAGVVTASLFDNWYPGYNDQFTTYHNGMGLLFETEGGWGADPETSGPADSEKEIHWYMPLPWKGSVWRLRDNIDYQETGVLLSLELTAKDKDTVLEHFYLKGKQAVEAGTNEPPYAYVIPAGQEDPAAVADLVANFLKHRIEVKEATAAFTAGGKTYPAGSYVVLLNQPYGRLAKTLLEKQVYQPYFNEPYDVTAWTYGLLRDVATAAVTDKAVFDVPLRPVEKAELKGTLNGEESSVGYLVKHQSNNNLVKLLGELWAQGAEVAQATAPFSVGSQTFAAGTLWVQKLGRMAFADFKAQVESLGLSGQALAAAPSGSFKALHEPKIGLYHGWVDTMDEGWTRYVLDYYGLKYDRLDNTAVKTGDLSQYDIIVLPDMRPQNILEGSSKMPPPYQGGLGKEGVAKLAAYVNNGGTLLAMGKAAAFPVEQGLVPGVKLVDLKGVNAPGSILGIKVDASQPVGYGFDAEEAVFYENNPAFVAEQGRVVASFTADPLLSGFLDDKEKKLSGKAAILDVPVGDGRVILSSPDLVYRFQAQGTIPFFFNSILSAASAYYASQHWH
jgi:hypothetical protein